MKKERDSQFSTLVEAVAYWAEKTPDKTCLIEAETDRRLSYGEFWRLIRVFAKRLLDGGLQKGDRVVVRVTQRIDTLIAAFGIYMAGGIYVPIAQKIGEERIKELLAYFEANLFIAVTPVEYDCAYTPIGAVYEDGDMLAGDALRFPDPDDVSDIFFTTGTTGTPKGVMRSFGGNCAAAENWLSVLDFYDSDVYMSFNMQHLIGGINWLRFSVLSGGTGIIAGPVLFLNDLFNAIKKYGVTITILRPAALSLLLNDEVSFKNNFGNLRAVGLTSASTSMRDLKRIKSILPNTRIFNNYGATEALSICSYEISKYDITPYCIGKPVKNCIVRIVTQDGEVLDNSSFENPGYISCKTPALMKGYWKNPELTKSVIRDGWLKMNDLGYMDSEGFVYLIGRTDEVINTGGYKVAPREIEECTLEINGVKECACIGAHDRILGSVPKLFVVMKDGAEFSAKEIQESLGHKLEAYKLPREIECIDSLPRTAGNGKINKKELQ